MELYGFDEATARAALGMDAEAVESSVALSAIKVQDGRPILADDEAEEVLAHLRRVWAAH